MQHFPTLVQDLGLARLTNSVYVGTMKFTIDSVTQFVNNFPPDVPEIDALRPQLADATAAFKTVNDAYALTLRSAITDEIAALDTEGDQLILAVKETVTASMRMTFDAEKSRQAGVYNEFLRKYNIDTRENMISEWSKVQQLCEEAAASESLTAAEAALGITAVMDRLTEIASEIRQKITQRSGELPDAQQMKKARTAMDPEYKALILMLNSLAVVYGQNGRFDSVIKTLNGNINYVKIHAISKSSGEAEPEPEPEPKPEGE